MNDKINDETKDIFESLDEQEQERRSTEPSESLLSTIDTEHLLEREREFKDVEKHWVRKEGWLRVARTIADDKRKTTQKNGIRYLTLPAYYRLDISLLLENGLIEITEMGNDGAPAEIFVVGFEEEPTKFGRMESQVPRLKLSGATKLEDALIDSNNEYHHQLSALFPFDVINLDLTTSLSPLREPPYSNTLQAIDKIFQLQAGYGLRWGLFLTFRNLPSEWREETINQLASNLQENLEGDPKVLEAFQRRYGQDNVNQLRKSDLNRCISQSVAKWVIDRGHHNGFAGKLENCYFYERYNPGKTNYLIYKQLFTFSAKNINPANIPTKGIPKQGWMADDLIGSINRHLPEDVQETLLKLSNKKPAIFEDLEKEINDLCNLVN